MVVSLFNEISTAVGQLVMEKHIFKMGVTGKSVYP